MEAALHLSADLLVPVGAVVVFASAVQAGTGFGFSIVAVPFLAVLLGVRDAVIVNLVLAMIANAAVTVRVWRHHDGRIVRPMVVGAMLGLAPGMVLFYNADVGVLRIGIAAVVTVVALLLLTGWSFRFARRRSGSAATGAASGFLAGSVGLGGPPLTVHLSGLSLGKVRYRATMSTYFTMLYIVLVPTHVVASGSFDVVAWALLFLPAVALGHWLGDHVFGRISQVWFLRGVSLVVLAAGVSGLVTGGI